MLLLHGFPASSRLWREQIAALVGAGYRVVAPELHGFGRSDKPKRVSAYKMVHIVSDLESLLERDLPTLPNSGSTLYASH
ncbi:MAG: alpha/beta fold hydrolase [Actinomycetota bacterium]|nr:alpha/beta fold hydrolase [Actinomycetota bacterium]